MLLMPLFFEHDNINEAAITAIIKIMLYLFISYYVFSIQYFTTSRPAAVLSSSAAMNTFSLTLDISSIASLYVL